MQMSPWLNKTPVCSQRAWGWPPVPARGRTDCQWKKQYWSHHGPLWALVPTLKPIFSPLFVGNVPTMHTNRPCGWAFTGPQSLSCLRWHLLSPPCSPQTQPRYPHTPPRPRSAASGELQHPLHGGRGPEGQRQPCPWTGHHRTLGKARLSAGFPHYHGGTRIPPEQGGTGHAHKAFYSQPPPPSKNNRCCRD